MQNKYYTHTHTHKKQQHVGFDSTHNIKTNNTKVTKSNYSEYLPGRIVTPFSFPYFFKFPETESSVYFGDLRISCFRSGRFSRVNLRSRRLEVVGERENGRVSPSRGPVFSCAHYLQAPATQVSRVACENIRFSSLFSAGDGETSPAAKSEEKRMFSKAIAWPPEDFTSVSEEYAEQPKPQDFWDFCGRNFMSPESRYFPVSSYCNMISQSNNAFPC